MWRIYHVETDSVDRSAFASLVDQSAELRQLAEEGRKLLPHFPALLRDLFATLYKFLIRIANGWDLVVELVNNRKTAERCLRIF